MKKILALSVLLLCCLASCTLPESHQDIRFAIAQGPVNLDPRYATDAASERVNRLIYQRLVEFDESSRPCAGLADWQRISSSQYRFTLKPQAQPFHHGKLLTMQDVAATYRSLLVLRDAPHRAEFSNIREIRVLDSQTLEFDLQEPDEDFPARLVIGILPADLIEAGHDFSHHPVGNGGFKFIAWNASLKLQRLRDDQQFTLTEVKDPTVRILKLKRGEIDMLQGDLPPELVGYLRGQESIDLQSGPGANFSYLGFNLQDPLLSKLAVRQAIAFGINRQVIIEKALVAGSRKAGAILPPEHWAGNPDLVDYEYNPALSRKLLKEAGFKLPIKLVYKTSTDAQRVRLATILQAQLREAGIALEIRSLDWGTFFDDVKHGNFQLYGLTWVGIKTPEIYRLAFHSDSIPPKGANRGRYADPVLDDLIEKHEWRSSTSRIHQQLPYVPLWYEGQFSALLKPLKNYPLKADGNWDGLATITRYAD